MLCFYCIYYFEIDVVVPADGAFFEGHLLCLILVGIVLVYQNVVDHFGVRTWGGKNDFVHGKVVGLKLVHKALAFVLDNTKFNFVERYTFF